MIRLCCPCEPESPATFQPYDWDADDGRLAPPKTIPAADVIIVDGVYAARPELADLVDLCRLPRRRSADSRRRCADREETIRIGGVFWERGEIVLLQRGSTAGELRHPARRPKISADQSRLEA